MENPLNDPLHSPPASAGTDRWRTLPFPLDVRPQHRKTMVLRGYGLALAARPLIGLAGHWGVVVALRSTDRLGKGLRGAPRDAVLADATPLDMRGRVWKIVGPGAAFGMTSVVALAGAGWLKSLYNALRATDGIEENR